MGWVSIGSAGLGSLVAGSCKFCVYGIQYEYQPNERETNEHHTGNQQPGTGQH